MQPFFKTPPKMTLSITNECPLQCAHCYGDCRPGAAAGELSIAQWIDFVDYLVENDFIELYIEGGEPMARAGFDDLLRYCARRMMTMVRTHGTLIDKDSAKRWGDFGVGRVFVDVMGATAATHDALTGVPGTFEKSCAAVRHLVAAGIPTDMLVILNRVNAGELQAYLWLARDLGAQRVGVLRLYPLGRAKRHWDRLALPLAEQTRVVQSLQPPPGLKLMQSWHPADANCCWQGATVDAHGRSIGCPYLREYVDFGNILEQPFLEGWHGNALYKQLRAGEVDAGCPDCSAREGTRGGCRSTAYAFHGSWTAPDPFCRHLNHGIRIEVLPQRLMASDDAASRAPSA